MRGFVLFFLLSPILLFSQDFDKVYLDSNWVITSIEDATFYRVSGFNSNIASYDGKVVDYYVKNDSIEMTGYYSNGMKNGDFNFYLPNGKLKRSTQFSNGARIGTWRDYYENGNLKLELEYTLQKEKIIHYNSNNGKSKFTGTKLNISIPLNEISAEHGDLKSSNSDNTINIKGRYKNLFRDGKWTITKNSDIYAVINYENGILKNGYLLLANNKYPITHNLAFPLISEHSKFSRTESFELKPGAIIKNNYVLEGLNEFKFKSMKKVTLKSYDEFVRYINDKFSLLSKTTVEKIIIEITVKDGVPTNCKTKPKVLLKSIQELNMILGTIEKLDFKTEGTLTVEYITEANEGFMNN